MSSVKVEYHIQTDLEFPLPLPSLDLTSRVRSVTWTDAVTVGGISASIALEYTSLEIEDLLSVSAIPISGGVAAAVETIPTVGGFIVIKRTDTNSAVWWGRISQIRESLFANAEGVVTSRPVVVECASWVSLLQRSRVLGVAGATAPASVPGAFYTASVLQPFLESLRAGVLTTKTMGPALAATWLILANNGRIPGSIAGGGLASFNTVPVVFDQATAGAFAPSRIFEQSAVPGLSLPALSTMSPRGSAWSFIENSFLPDPNLVELFPALEPPATDEDVIGTTAQAAQAAAASIPFGPANRPSDRVTGYSLDSDTETSVRYRETARKEAEDKAKEEAANLLTGGLGGSRPVLIYRMKPHLEDAAPPLFLSPNAVPSLLEINANDIISLDTVFDDMERINGWGIRTPFTPNSQMKILSGIGDTLVDSGSANSMGLRYFEPSWPFVDVGSESSPEGLINIYFSNIIRYAQRISFKGEARPSGSILMKYRPSVRAGRWYSINFLKGIRGSTAALPGFYIVYADRVTNTITVRQDGVEVKRTTIHFVRARSATEPPQVPPLSIPSVLGSPV